MRPIGIIALHAVMICIVALGSFENAAAQSPPGQQIRLIVPFPAGGPTDIVARPFAQMLGEALNSTIVIDNRDRQSWWSRWLARCGLGCEIRTRWTCPPDGNRWNACDQPHIVQQTAL